MYINELSNLSVSGRGALLSELMVVGAKEFSSSNRVPWDGTWIGDPIGGLTIWLKSWKLLDAATQDP